MMKNLLSDANNRKKVPAHLLHEHEELWQEKAMNFMASLKTKFAPHYNDFLHPLFSALQQIMFGLRMLRSASAQVGTHGAQIMQEESQERINKALLSEFVCDLISFPVVENMSVATSVVSKLARLMDGDVILALLQQRGNGKISASLRGVPSLVLRNVLCRAYLHVRHTRHVSYEMLRLLDSIFSTFANMYKRQKQKEKEKEEEEKELFKTKRKAKHHLIPTEEEEEENELQDMFPDYWQDFADLQELEDKDDDYKPATDNATSITDEKEMLVASEEDIQDWEIHHIHSLHRHIYNLLYNSIEIPDSCTRTKVIVP